MKSKFEQDELDRMREDPANYKWGFFYYNPKDQRGFVPKRIGFGWSPNFAKPDVYLFLIGILIFTILMGNIDKIFK